MVLSAEACLPVRKPRRQHILEWQDTVKGMCGGSYQVPLGGNTDKSVLLPYQKITSLIVWMTKVY